MSSLTSTAASEGSASAAAFSWLGCRAVTWLALLVLVLAGIRDEERRMSLTSTPRTRTEAVTRRLPWAGVRTPQAGHGTDQDPDSPEAI